MWGGVTPRSVIDHHRRVGADLFVALELADTSVRIDDDQGHWHWWSL